MAVVQQEKSMSLVPDNVARLKPYAPGKPIEEVQKELGLTDVLKLASNESPLGPSTKALDAIAEIAPKIALYPDGLAPVLREPIAAHMNVPEDHIVFGNGSDELLHLICETFVHPGVSGTVQADPSFAMYHIYATLAGANVTKVPLRNYTHDLDAMAEAIRLAADRSEIVLITGGLGPTLDDLTREALAKFGNVELVRHEPSLEHVKAMFARRNRPMPERNVMQAMFPKGSEPLPNPRGTAPGIWMTYQRKDGSISHVAAMPGVPSEMRTSSILAQ